MPNKTNFLDGDDKKFKESLKFVKNDMENEINSYFGDNANNKNVLVPPRDYKVVETDPGFCIKSFRTNTKEKFFINVCHTKEIPPPEDITEMQLGSILASDEPSTFKIPMSISEIRIATDKASKPCDVCDIAINSKFLEKCFHFDTFKGFFLTLIFEALSDKYNIQINSDTAIILSNRKVMGSLVSHRIRNTDVNRAMDKNNKSEEMSKIQEISNDEFNQIKQKHYARLQGGEDKIVEPIYSIRTKRNDEDRVCEMMAEIFMPNYRPGDLIIQIGRNRLIVETKNGGFKLDKAVKLKLLQNKSRAFYLRNTQMLHIYVAVDQSS